MKQLRDRLLDVADEFEIDPEKYIAEFLAVCGEAFLEHGGKVEHSVAGALLSRHQDRISLIPGETIGKACYDLAQKMRRHPVEDLDYAMNIESYMVAGAERVAIPLRTLLLIARDTEMNTRSSNLHH